MAEHLPQLRLAALDFTLLAARRFPAMLVPIALELDAVSLDLRAKLSDGVIVPVTAPVASIVIVRERKRRDRERSKGDSEDGDFLETEHD
jgi:hypothetical protein